MIMLVEQLAHQWSGAAAEPKPAGDIVDNLVK
jgi:hypothetical protein